MVLNEKDMEISKLINWELPPAIKLQTYISVNRRVWLDLLNLLNAEDKTFLYNLNWEEICMGRARIKFLCEYGFQQLVKYREPAESLVISRTVLEDRLKEFRCWIAHTQPATIDLGVSSLL